jgi:TPR repeat protein
MPLPDDPPPPPRRRAGGWLFWVSAALVAVGGAALAGSFFFLIPLVAGAPSKAVPLAPPLPSDAPADRWQERLDAAASLLADEDYAGAVAAYAALATDDPARPEPRARLEMIAALLRSNGFTMTPAKFAALRPALEAASRHQVVSAQVLLGEQLRDSAPAESLKFFRLAAEAGQTEAMTQAGLMISNGRGSPARDLKQAVAWFERASAAGDTDAMTALAECLIHGKGIAPNPRRAAELLRAASAFQHPRALNLLGDLYARGIGVPKNPDEAFLLFSRSAALGDGDGVANLGALTMEGEGTGADPARAIKIWKSGITRGFPSCMLNYAKALESGRGIPTDPAQAKHWYREAARGGNADAEEWCRKHRVAY